MEECFVCGQHLDGDPAFIQHHLNRCLDRQGSSRSPLPFHAPVSAHPTLSGPSTAPSLSLPPLSPSSSSARRQTDSDAALALALSRLPSDPALVGAFEEEEEERERADRELALRLARGQEARAVTSGEGEGEACPCCEARWVDLGLSSSPSSPSLAPTPTSSAASLPAPTRTREDIDLKRRTHVQKCFDARAKVVEQSGLGAAGMHGMWEETDDGSGCGSGSSGKGGQGWTAGTAGTARTWTGGTARGRDSVPSTPSLIPLLHSALSKSFASSYGRTSRAYLADGGTEHVSTRMGDWGWGCGYKNLQMLFSSARHLPAYASLFSSAPPASSSSSSATTASGGSGLQGTPVPTIREWQEIVEEAWKAGHDPLGASHFGHRLVGSRRWIGTTEAYTALTWLGVRATIVDFPKIPGGEGTHQSLVRWILDYFSEPQRSPSPSSTASSSAPSSSGPSTSPKNAFTALLSSASSSSSAGSPIRLTSKQPLYLQHRGHSRTVVGVEVGKASGGKRKGGTMGTKQGGGAGGGGKGREEEEMWLLVFDSGKPIPQDVKRAAASLASSSSPIAPTAPYPDSSSTTASSSSTSILPPPLKRLKSSSPPAPTSSSTPRSGFGKLSAALSSATSKDKAGKKADNPRGGEGGIKYGEVLKVFRVNMGQLKRREEYQILYIDPLSPPLSSQEKHQRKTVKSKLADPPPPPFPPAPFSGGPSASDRGRGGGRLA